MSAEQELLFGIGAGAKLHDVSIRGRKIHYAVAGSGPAVVLIHGLNIGWGFWHANIAALAKERSVWAVDLPGAGSSETRNVQNPGWGEEIVDMLDEFIQREVRQRTSIIGHSIGGWAALRLAAAGKPYLEKLVLVSALGFTNYLPWRYRAVAFSLCAKFLSKTAVRPTRGNIKKFIQSVMHDTQALNETFVDYYHETLARKGVLHPILLINGLIVPFRIREQFVLGEELRRVAVPSLIIAGEKDTLVPVSKSFPSFSLLPNARAEIYPNTGHLAPIEQTDKFNASVANFFANDIV